MKSGIRHARLMAWAAATLAASITAAGTPSPQGVPVYRVGAGCAHATIQGALDAIPSGGSGILRIRTGLYPENILTGNRHVSLLGGHADCATTTQTGYSTISGAGSALPTVRFTALSGSAGTTYGLYLNRVDVSDGTGASDGFPGGGISVVTSTDLAASVELDNVHVYNNSTPFHGGGIALLGSSDSSLVLWNDSRIYTNSVTNATGSGGGLSCLTGFTVFILGGSVHGNSAGVSGGNARGGGISLQGCDLTWYAQGTGSGAATLRDNTVHGRGGALYASSGAQVDLVGAHLSFGSGPSTRPLLIHNNVALGNNGLGGAFHATGSGTRVSVDRSWTYNNRADYSGGAAYAIQGAEIVLQRSQAVCHNTRQCSRVFGNSAGVVAGAAAAVNAGSQLNIRRTILADNQVDGALGAVLRSDNQAMLRLEDSLLVGASDTDHTIVLVSGQAEIRRSTIADTMPDLSVFRIVNTNNNLLIRDSIIHETDDSAMVVLGAGAEQIVESACVIWHDDGLSALGLSAQTMTANPAFVDRDDGLYYLKTESPAVNYCFDIGQPPDLEWRPRGIAHSGRPVLHGPVDLGAYEWPLGLFKDRFQAP